MGCTLSSLNATYCNNILNHKSYNMYFILYDMMIELYSKLLIAIWVLSMYLFVYLSYHGINDYGLAIVILILVHPAACWWLSLMGWKKLIIILFACIFVVILAYNQCSRMLHVQQIFPRQTLGLFKTRITELGHYLSKCSIDK